MFKASIAYVKILRASLAYVKKFFFLEKSIKVSFLLGKWGLND